MSIRSLIDEMIDPALGITDAVELFPDDAIPAAIRSARVERETGRIFLPLDFVGRNKVLRALAAGREGNVPIVIADGVVSIALGWLEARLPEYAGLWARVEMSVDRALPGRRKPR